MPATDELSAVGQEVHRHDGDRFLTVLMAPPDRREDLFALYAFNSEVARIPEVTSESLLARMRVQWWRDVVAAIYERGQAPAGHPVAEALAQTILRRDLPRPLLDSLLDARDTDSDPEPIPTLDALDTYVEGTGGALTQLAAHVLGATGEEAQEAADLVGRAYALVGLLRATPFLARQKRLYLPPRLLADAGTSREAVLRGQSEPGLEEVTRRITKGATDTLAEARRRRSAVPRSAVAAYLPAVLADGYLRRLRSVGHDVFHPRMTLPKRRPLALLVAAWRGRF